jgi:DNA-binding PadR family transcriptional regulator
MPISPLQILLLTQMEEGPKYGYEMLKQLKTEFEGIWEPKTGTVYPALRSLEKKGYVETQEKEGTDFYYITSKGRGVFELLMGHVVDSIEFSVKYINVIFKWLSAERKQGAIQLIEHLSQKEQFLSHRLLEDFTENVDSDIREPFLRQLHLITAKRLDAITHLLEDH